jgi:hypothetical protein
MVAPQVLAHHIPEMTINIMVQVVVVVPQVLY